VIRFFFQDLVQLSPQIESAVLGLLLLGSLWIAFLLHRFRKNFWISDWLRTQSLLQSQLQWGLSLPQALSRLQTPDSWPKELASWWEEANTQARHFEPTLSMNFLKDKDSRKLAEYWHFCLERFRQNEGVLALVEQHIPILKEDFEGLCEKRAELLSVKLMAPLFLCFCPAFLLLCLGPLLSELNKF
jgi:hypothetical protein